MSKIIVRDGTMLTASGWVEGYLVVDGGQIVEIGAGTPPAEMGADEVVSARHAAVLPGLVNGHTHLSQTFMRGLAGGRPLLRWLKERIWPIQQTMTPEQLHLAALLGLVENLRCGATQVVNHHKIIYSQEHTDRVLAAAQQVGLRFILARSWVDRGAHAESAGVILADLERLCAQWHQPEGMIQIANGPLATWRCSAETLRSAHALSRRYGSFTHIHVSESQDEVQASLDETGLRPVAWLDAIGVLDEFWQIVHAVWVDEAEMELLAGKGAMVVHCPVSNAVLASGVMPLAAMMRRGLRLRLGSDGPASNDTQDLWETIKAAVMFGRAIALEATAVAPEEALALALSAPALEVGQRADLIVVDLNHVRAAPVQDVPSALALCTHGSDVKSVMVAGRMLMKDKKVLVVDEEALLDECRKAILHLRTKAGLG